MTSVKKPCINSSKHYYTGTELSPLHFGLSAEGYEINSVMEGYDKELWVVDIKNNKKGNRHIFAHFLRFFSYFESQSFQEIEHISESTEAIKKLNTFLNLEQNYLSFVISSKLLNPLLLLL